MRFALRCHQLVSPTASVNRRTSRFSTRLSMCLCVRSMPITQLKRREPFVPGCLMQKPTGVHSHRSCPRSCGLLFLPLSTSKISFSTLVLGPCCAFAPPHLLTRKISGRIEINKFANDEVDNNMHLYSIQNLPGWSNSRHRNGSHF